MNIIHWLLMKVWMCQTTAQLAIFVSGIDVNFNITKDMLSLQEMKDTTTREDIFQELKKSMARYNLKFDKLHGISTDEAPAIVGNKLGLIAKIKSEMANTNINTKNCAYFTVSFTNKICVPRQSNFFMSCQQ